MSNQYLLSKPEARVVLEPYATPFYKAIRDGFSDFAEMQSIKPLVENHAKATALWDYILQKIKVLVLNSNGDLKLERKKRMCFLVVKSQIAIKFKKFNKDSISANIVTVQVEQFRNHSFEFQSVQLFPMEIGWQVDELYSLAKVDFVSPDGDGLLWKIEFKEQGNTRNEIFKLESDDIFEEGQTLTPKTGTEDAKTAS
ncbi:MAG: hypothetical protein EOP51_06305 [Sphingobacteriales bacterium]|nr:MAG: hypothetical protein EOP51_06305 [Sphingobacteriales bacterium]